MRVTLNTIEYKETSFMSLWITTKQLQGKTHLLSAWLVAWLSASRRIEFSCCRRASWAFGPFSSWSCRLRICRIKIFRVLLPPMIIIRATQCHFSRQCVNLPLYWGPGSVLHGPGNWPACEPAERSFLAPSCWAGHSAWSPHWPPWTSQQKAPDETNSTVRGKNLQEICGITYIKN